MLVGEIVETHIDEDKLSGNVLAGKPDISKLNPLVYCTGVREYWSMGKKLGDGYAAWKKI